MVNAILIDQKDNVVTLVSDIKSGDEVEYQVGSGINKVKAIEKIPYGHKMAIDRIAQGGDIVKYGEAIGHAKKDIQPGAWIHSHNTNEIYAPSLEV
jgi:altronate dehydratase